MMQYMQNVLKAVMHFSFTAGENFLMVEHPNFHILYLNYYAMLNSKTCSCNVKNSTACHFLTPLPLVQKYVYRG